MLKPKNILIVDLYSAANRGDAAILEGLVGSLKQEVPCSSFTIHTLFPQLVEHKENWIVRRPLIPGFIGSFLETTRTGLVCLTLMICSILNNFSLNLSFILPQRYRLSFNDFLQADILVGMGGGFYNDNYWPALPSRLCHLLLGKLLRKPVVISAHSIGPFKKKIFQVLARFTFNKVDAICVRDEASLHTLQALRISPQKVYKVADSAWLIDEIPVNQAQKLLEEQEKVDLSQPLLISLSTRHWPYYSQTNPMQNHNSYVSALAQALNILIEKYQATVVFLSTCTNAGPYSDGRVALEIQSYLKAPEKFCLVSQDYKPVELKGMYRCMHLHIGTRMHSVILALSAGTPCLGISYEPKLASLMKEMGLQDYVVDIENVTADNLVAGIENILKNRADYTAILQREIPRLQKLAQKNAQVIAQCIVPLTE